MSADVASRAVQAEDKKRTKGWGARLSGAFSRPLEEDGHAPKDTAGSEDKHAGSESPPVKRGSGGEGRRGLLGTARHRKDRSESEEESASGESTPRSAPSTPKGKRRSGKGKDGLESKDATPKEDTKENNSEVRPSPSSEKEHSADTPASEPTSPKGYADNLFRPQETKDVRPTRTWATGSAVRNDPKQMSLRRGRGLFGFGSKIEEPPPEPTQVHIPIAVESGQVALVIECPDHKFQRTVRVSDQTTLNELLAKIVKKNPFPDVNDYAFFVRDNKARGPLSKLEPLKNFTFEPMTVLQLVRTQVVLKVEWEGVTFNIATQPESSVKQVLQQVHMVIRKKTTLDKPNEYCLFFPMEKGGEIMLEEKRTIASYRLNSQTLLYFKKISKSLTSEKKSAQRLDKIITAEKETGDGKVYLIVESPTHGIKKTLSFSPDTQVMEVMRQFNRYCKAPNTSAYSLVIPPGSSNAEEVVLDNMQRLHFYNFEHLTLLHFKDLSAAPAAGPRMTAIVNGLGSTLRRKTMGGSQDKQVTKNAPPPTVFGVDPLTLPLVEDNGFQVPNFLAQMRKSLYEKNALNQEGLFRLAGDEMEMNLIKKQLNEGSYMDCIDVNAVSTLIKRWFGGLPVRVFAALPKEDYELCVRSEEACKTFPDKLAEPQRTLFLWFAAILVDVAKRQTINKMTPGNLAVVTAPILAHIPDGNPIEGLIITGNVVNIITVYIQHRLKQEATTE